MRDDSLPVMRAGIGTAESEIIIGLCESFRQAMVISGLDIADPQSASLGMAAAATFSGILFGQLIPVGCVSRQDQRRFVELMVKNIRSGVNIGEDKASRVVQRGAMN